MGLFEAAFVSFESRCSGGNGALQGLDGRRIQGVRAVGRTHAVGISGMANKFLRACERPVMAEWSQAHGSGNDARRSRRMQAPCGPCWRVLCLPRYFLRCLLPSSMSAATRAPPPAPKRMMGSPLAVPNAATPAIGERKLATLARVPLLIIDDFGLKPLRAPADEDLHDLIAERYEQAATIIPSNLDHTEWDQAFATNRLLASATLDRLRHNAYCLELDGPSYRDPKVPPAEKKSPQKTAEKRSKMDSPKGSCETPFGKAPSGR